MNPRQTPLVLVFSASYLPCIGGAEIAIDEVTKRVVDMRFLILTARYTRRLPRYEKKGDVEIVRLGFGVKLDKWLLPLTAFFAGKKIIKERGVRILWCVMISQAAIAAYLLKKIYTHLALCITLQEGDSEEHLRYRRLGLIDFFWRRLLKVADGVTAISNYLAERAQSSGYSKNVRIIPNGVREEYLKGETLKDSKKVVLSVSRLVEKNGLDDLLCAFKLLEAGGNPYRLLVIGEGPLRSKLEKLRAELGLENSVEFLGLVPHEELLEYYRKSLVFVRPSRSEGLGSVFLEAMGAGVPVVATPVGGIVDFLEDGKTGIFVEPGNPESISEGLKRVLGDQALAYRIGSNGRELIREKYLWPGIAEAYAKFLKKFL